MADQTGVTIPFWAWTVMGGAAALLGSQALRFVLDIVLLQLKQKGGGESPTGTSSANQCPGTCRPLWQSEIATANANTKVEIGDIIRQEVRTLHERLDEVLRR